MCSMFRRCCSEVHKLSQPTTRVVLNIFSHLWEIRCRLAAAMKLARPKLDQNWLTVQDLRTLLSLAGFEIVDHRQEVLMPCAVPGLRSLANRYLVKLGRSAPCTDERRRRAPRTAIRGASAAPTVSVIVPARNEAGNIAGSSARFRKWAAAPRSSSSRGIPPTKPTTRSRLRFAIIPE